MAYPTKTGAQIIVDFELQVNDVTELSAAEELSIMNRVYQRLCAKKPWEFLKKNGTGSTTLDSDSVYSIPVPDDFAYFTENANWTDNTIAYQVPSSPRVVFIGTTYKPYNIINYSDRLQYRNADGFVYFDPSANRIKFTKAPTASDTYNFDYIKIPAQLTTATSPIFPGRFHDIIQYGMAAENDILQLSEKARSYQADNQVKYNEYFLDMEYWNAQLALNN